MEIGKRLKELRLQKKFSLEQLAQKVGLTRSFISQIEKDKTSPSISSLLKILAALSITMADFFQSIEKTKGVVLKKDKTKLYYDQESKTKLASLSSGFSNPKFEPFFVKMEAGGSSELLCNQGQTFGYGLTGTVQLTLGEEIHVLEPGDSVYFDSSIPHRWTVIGNTSASGIWITNESMFKIL